MSKGYFSSSTTISATQHLKHLKLFNITSKINPCLFQHVWRKLPRSFSVQNTAKCIFESPFPFAWCNHYSPNVKQTLINLSKKVFSPMKNFTPILKGRGGRGGCRDTMWASSKRVPIELTITDHITMTFCRTRESANVGPVAQCICFWILSNISK